MGVVINKIPKLSYKHLAQPNGLGAKKKNLTSNWMSIRLTAFRLKIFNIALIALLSFSYGRYVVNKEVFISILKTITTIP